MNGRVTKCILFVALLSAPRPALMAAWLIKTVDSVGRASSDHRASLALDGKGRPHVSYFDADHTSLKYAAWNDASWDIQTVAHGGKVGDYNSLALDEHGRPRIAYRDYTNRALKYAAWNGSSWDVQTVEAGFAAGNSVSLALDRGGSPHMIHTGNNQLKYVVGNKGSWQTVIVSGRACWDTSLVLDRAGNPHVSYWHYSSFSLRYAFWNGASWNERTVDDGGNVRNWLGHHNSLALDAKGNPRIAYIDQPGNTRLKYATWNGASWDTQIVDESDQGRYVGAISLALSAGDSLRISYLCTGKGLRYASWNGGKWDIQRVEEVASVDTSFTSLSLDAVGNPVILYATHQGDIKIASVPGPAKPALPAAHPSLTATNTIGSHISPGQQEELRSAQKSHTEVDSQRIWKTIDRGDALKQEGNLSRAIATYSQAIRLDPSLAEAHYKRGTVYLAKGDLPRAISDLSEAVRLRPDYARAYYRRGLAHSRNGDLDKAIQDFTRAVGIRPRYARAFNKRGLAYFRKHEFDKAIADFTAAVRLDPTYIDALFNRGEAYWRKGELDKALVDFEEVICLGRKAKKQGH